MRVAQLGQIDWSINFQSRLTTCQSLKHLSGEKFAEWNASCFSAIGGGGGEGLRMNEKQKK